MHLFLATGVQFMRGYAFISYLLKDMVQKRVL